MTPVPDPLAETMSIRLPVEPDGGPAVTIGVAVPVPEPFGTELQRWRESFNDPLARAIPTHVTLLPPTEIHRSDLGEVDEHLAKAAATGRPFPMVLKGTGTFRPVSAVTFIQVACGGEECTRIEAVVRSGLLARELHFPYHPHVTVAHELPDDVLRHAQTVLADYEARFQIDEFAVYEHGGDGVWRIRRSFPFSR